MSLPADDSTRVFQRAVQWLSDLQDGATDSAALFRWLAESPRHVEEFAFALSFTDEIAGLTAEQCAEIAAMNAAQREMQSVVALAAPNVAHEVEREEASFAVPIERRRRKMPYAVAAAASVIVAVGGAVLWWDYGWQTYATDFGEQRVVELSDGSVVHLNTESRVKVKFSGTARDIRMIAGEALFKVHHDPLHPFRVHADGNVIQAVGTQFNVYRRATSTVVAVLEGRVRIIPDGAGSKAGSSGTGDTQVIPVANLSVGQEARIAAKGNITTRQIDVLQAAAWRQHRLVFRNDALSDIAAEFNRYNRRPQIRIEDARAGARRFAATFDANAPDALVQVLKTNPDLTVERIGNEIVVRSRTSPGIPAPDR